MGYVKIYSSPEAAAVHIIQCTKIERILLMQASLEKNSPKQIIQYI